jgi:hypothetical protein
MQTWCFSVCGPAVSAALSVLLLSGCCPCLAYGFSRMRDCILLQLCGSLKVSHRKSDSTVQPTASSRTALLVVPVVMMCRGINT